MEHVDMFCTMLAKIDCPVFTRMISDEISMQH